MIAEPHADAVGGQIEQARHLLAGDVPARGLVDLDELGTRGDETAQLLVDDLGEALGDVHDALVDLARVDPRAEGERAGAGRLRVPGRVCLEVLELFDDAEPAWRRLDPRSEEHTSELQSLTNLVCRLLLEKKNNDRRANGD